MNQVAIAGLVGVPMDGHRRELDRGGGSVLYGVLGEYRATVLPILESHIFTVQVFNAPCIVSRWATLSNGSKGCLQVQRFCLFCQWALGCYESIPGKKFRHRYGQCVNSQGSVPPANDRAAVSIRMFKSKSRIPSLTINPTEACGWNTSLHTPLTSIPLRRCFHV